MLTFYATLDADSDRSTTQDCMPDVPYLLPASSWARQGLRAPRLPVHVTHTAADCGGYVATKVWGDYRYTPRQYVGWLETFGPSWAAAMDYCCEDEITNGRPGIVRERQARTTAMACHFWREYRACPWVWAPTVQGWTPADYQRHARELAPLIEEMRAHYGHDSAFRVGVGTLCKRADAAMIHKIVSIIARELPGVPLHLWGVKLDAFKTRVALPSEVVSVDSAAWNSDFGTNIGAWKQSGLRRLHWRFLVALPAYRAKVEAALSRPKQSKMFLDLEEAC